ncbi:MAG: ATPase, T2SS/T4P/T4SS family [bacterium]|nr:ATPase, T2SS/T4P/T4SS family [bacterium]
MEVPSILLNRILSEASQKNGSDLHLTVGSPPMVRSSGRFAPLTGHEMLTAEVINKMVETLLSAEEIAELKEKKDLISVKNISNFRFRVNIFYQKGLIALSFHFIPAVIKSFKELGLAESCDVFFKANSGLIVIAGAYNSGKTTTAAALIEEFNKTKPLNIVTIEDPIEYMFIGKKSLIAQRQVGRDVETVDDALNYCLSEDVDLVYVNEIKDERAFNSAIPKIFELASGNCLAVLEVNADSVERVLEKILIGFSGLPAEAARYNLADILVGALVQKLVKRRGGGLVLANEILLNSSAVKSLIREGKIYQLRSVMQTSRRDGMISLEKSLENLVNSNEIRREDI